MPVTTTTKVNENKKKWKIKIGNYRWCTTYITNSFNINILRLFNTYMVGNTQNPDPATCIFLLIILFRFLNKSNTVYFYFKLMTLSHLYRSIFFFVDWRPCMEIKNIHHQRTGELSFKSDRVHWLLPVAAWQQPDYKHSSAHLAVDTDNGTILVSNIRQYSIGVLNNYNSRQKSWDTRSKFSPSPTFRVDNQLISFPFLLEKNAIFCNIDYGG